MAYIRKISHKNLSTWVLVLNIGISASLTGCGTPYTAAPAGNLAAASPEINQELARDALLQLRALYAPATTQFNLSRGGADSFGASLKAGLRDKGYAVLETNNDASGIPLAYLIDQPDAGMYRVALTVDWQMLTRAYLLKNGAVGAAGAWARRVISDQSEKPLQASVGRTVPATSMGTGIPDSHSVTPTVSALPSIPSRLPVSAAVPVSLFVVNANELAVMQVLRRWARAEKLDFSWSANIDYAITNRMRAIQSESFPSAIAAMRAALNGVSVPLTLNLSADGLFITLAEQGAAGSANGALVVAASSANIAFQPPVVPPSAAVTPFTAPVKALLPPVQAVLATPATAINQKVPPPPNVSTLTGWGIAASVIADQSADAAARKAGGVMSARWLVNDSPSLRAIVEIWAKESGYRVDWSSTRDYAVNDAVKTGIYTGTLNEALMRLASAFGQFDTPLGMTFINSGGAKTVYVFDL